MSHQEIQLTDKRYADKDKKEKRVQKPREKVEPEIRKMITNEPYLTIKEIADILDIPESQVKTILNEICDLMIDVKKKKFYKLKDDDF